MTCHLVAPVVPIEVPEAVETHDEEMRDSRNVSEYEAPQIPVLERARGVNDLIVQRAPVKSHASQGHVGGEPAHSFAFRCAGKNESRD